MSGAASSEPGHLVSGAKRFFLKGADRALVRRMESGLDRVERSVRTHAGSADPVVDAVSRYLVEAGGKRVRPLLVLLTAQLGSGITDEVVAAATVVELTHVASLYHDDVMDEADLRRGVPTAQRTWTNSIAILAGDILFARASELVAPLGERALRMQASTFARLCEGQMRETLGPAESDDPIEFYLQVLADKTGSLIAAAAQYGILLSGADEQYLAPVREYGEAIGVAFQLIDDVIDVRSTQDESGKVPGTDLRDGVPTMPWLLLQRRAVDDPEARAEVERITALLDDDATLPDALAQLGAHTVTEETLQIAHTWADRAVAALEPLPEGPVRAALGELADTIVSRSH
ncbi:MAG: polyprenyl synthetase family protein [Microbacteriaceae bacterium]|nr:polyprenyl synthetase family protein [Microbacteriaceae bacterium]MCI1206860.1 polyprenyl synthetase family protein [Microbacteriaceae bacterium]